MLGLSTRVSFALNLLWAQTASPAPKLLNFLENAQTVKCARCPTGYGRGNMSGKFCLRCAEELWLPNAPAGSDDDIICQACQVGRFGKENSQETIDFATTALLVGTSQRRSNRAACGALQDFILTNQAMDLDTHASPAHWVKSHHFSIQQVVRCAQGKTTRLEGASACSTCSAGDLVHLSPMFIRDVSLGRRFKLVKVS